MATPLRYALILLLWAIMAAVYLPLVPAAFSLIAPALSLPHWLALFADPQLPQALLATLVSTGLAAGGALIIALLAILALWPGAGWARLSTRLPWLLAIPHVAFATSVLLVFAEGGILWQWLPFLSPQPDRYGIGLGVTLAVKESAFLLWILSALLSEKQLSQQVIVLDSLGYSRLQCLNWLVLPAIGPALGKAMLAIVAWSLSVVDVAIVLGKLNEKLEQQKHTEWLSHIADYQKMYPMTIPKEGLSGPFMIAKIYEMAKDAIMVTEVGQHQMWAAQYFKYSKPRTLLTSGGLGTMGYGLGAAIGAQTANPDKQVINIAGDGCFRMNMNELATASRQKLPLIEVIVNNHVLGMVRQWQTLFYKQHYSATVLDDGVDYVKIAEAMGAAARRVTTQEEFNAAFQEALESKTPFVIDAIVDSDDKVWPMVAPGAPINECFDGKDFESKNK